MPDSCIMCDSEKMEIDSVQICPLCDETILPNSEWSSTTDKAAKSLTDRGFKIRVGEIKHVKCAKNTRITRKKPDMKQDGNSLPSLRSVAMPFNPKSDCILCAMPAEPCNLSSDKLRHLSLK